MSRVEAIQNKNKENNKTTKSDKLFIINYYSNIINVKL